MEEKSPFGIPERLRGNTQNWFNGELLEKLSSRDILFKAFKKTRLHIHKKIYKKAKYNALKLIATKEQAFFNEKLSETVDNSKELHAKEESSFKLEYN